MLKRIINKASLGLYSLLFILLFFPDASAQTILRLLPPIQEVKVQRGRIGAFTVTVINTGDEDAPCKFSAHDMDVSIDGRPFIADSGSARGCGQWITLNTEECIIKAHETFTLQGTIQVPRTAEGGYYALIQGTFMGTTIPLGTEKAKIKEPQIRLESHAVVASLLTVPSSRNKPVIIPDTLFVYPHGQEEDEVEDSKVNFREKNGWEIVMPVRNDGNVHTRVSGRVSFWSESGVHIESAPLYAGKGYLLPGKLRNFAAEGKNELSDGYYLMRIALQTSERYRMSKDFPFAVYEGKVYPGAVSEELAELIRASSPGFLLKNPFIQRKITPGGSSYMAIQIMNTINDTLTLLPRTVEWNLNDIGQPILGYDNAIQPRSCTKWIELSEDNFLIRTGRSKSFKLKLRIPDEASGAYYAAIVFDRDRLRPDLPAEFMSARTQLIALTTSRNLQYGVKIDTIILKKESARELTVYRFLFTITNKGNVHCFAKGSLSLEKEVAKGVYEPVGRIQDYGDTQMYLLPGNKRPFEIHFPELEPGVYRVILAVNYKEETQPIVKYQKFVLK